eukprot:300525-Heterocapsa_arctica.AAC.1
MDVNFVIFHSCENGYLFGSSPLFPVSGFAKEIDVLFTVSAKLKDVAPVHIGLFHNAVSGLISIHFQGFPKTRVETVSISSDVFNVEA